MAQFDTGPIRDFAAEWIQYGDGLYELAQSMKDQMDGMQWSGKAAVAAREGFGSGEQSVRSSMLAAADIAWKTGEALNIYADEVDKAVKEINKQRLVAALANIFGLALLGLTVGVGILLMPYLEMFAEWATAVINLAERSAAEMFGIELAAFAAETVIASGLGLGSDLLIQLMANAAAGEKMHIDWANEAWAIGLGAEAVFATKIGEKWLDPAVHSQPHTAPTATGGTGEGPGVPVPASNLPKDGGAAPGFSGHTVENPPAHTPLKTTELPPRGTRPAGAEAPAPHPVTSGPNRTSAAATGETTPTTGTPAPVRSTAQNSAPAGTGVRSGADPVRQDTAPTPHDVPGGAKPEEATAPTGPGPGAGAVRATAPEPSAAAGPSGPGGARSGDGATRPAPDNGAVRASGDDPDGARGPLHG
ncbi:hypothetical protein G3I42_21405, partial [Streptomyces sp. SID11385]|nr:hypothetical protein [Streptomyces sp. SID11385]